MVLLIASAFADSCGLVLSTREAFTPEAGDFAQVGGEAGWRKARMAELDPAQRAKVELYKRAFKRYPEAVQEALLRGDLPDGLDEVAVTLAWGEPLYVWRSNTDCRGLLYGVDDGRPVAFESCSGVLSAPVHLVRTVSCRRLLDVHDRLEKKHRQLRPYTFVQQLDIVAGHTAEWLDEPARELAYGKGPVTDLGPIHDQDVPSHEPEPTPSPERRTPTVAPPSAPPVPSSPALAPATVASLPPVDAVMDAPVPVGNWTFHVHCGRPRTIELDLDGTFSATASARTAAGGLERSSLRGRARSDGERVQLFGLGVFTPSTGELELGPWPEAACAGVSVAADR